MTREYSLHFAIRRLWSVLTDNPSADWCKDWIDAYAYLCGCEKCMTYLKKNDIDIKMIDGVFDL